MSSVKKKAYWELRFQQKKITYSTEVVRLEINDN